jgi:D-alanine-D-alanine ligase
VLSKVVAEANGILTPKYEYVLAETFAQKGPEILKDLETSLNYPLFVKPARLGSSIGISRVESSRELMNAIEVAMHFDNKVVVEEAVNNLIEVTVPIMGNKQLTPALVEQPLSPSDGVFDFDTKYMNQGKGGKKMGSSKASGSQGYSRLPADISKELYEESLMVAKQVYRAVGCQGIARIDLLIDSKANKVYFNEINPLPGSLYAHNWRASGISTVELVSKLVDLAEERWAEKQKIATTFSTNFLKQF